MAIMLHDIPSCMCSIVAFLSFRADVEHKLSLLSWPYCVYFALKSSLLFYDPTMDEEVNDYVCVLATA